MRETYETLDEYLEDLDKIKAAVASETSGMDAKQIVAYFAQARKELERLTGMKIQTRKPGRQGRTRKP